MAEADDNSGAYQLVIRLPRRIEIEAGSLGTQQLKAGTYVYVGSAKRGLRQRVGRHRRLADEKQGRCHWHVDRLLMHPDSRLVRIETFAAGDESSLSHALADQPGVTVPVAHFGATDCQHGCKAHLYRLK